MSFGNPFWSSDFERPAGSELRAPAVALPDAPVVSLIMTCFNGAIWLESAIRSAMAQSWPHLEVILVDDCSTDSSLTTALRLAQADSRLRVLRMDRNAGTYCAKNAGMAAAKGDVFTFMDSDDTCAPDRILRQLELLRSPGLVATTCNYERRTARGDLVMNLGLPARQALISLMIKREVLDEVGWFDSVRRAADDEYFERIRHTYGRQAHANVDATLYRALHREDSLSTSGPAANQIHGSAQQDGLSMPRRDYVHAYRAWYAQLAERGMRPYLPRRLRGSRPFIAPTTICVGT